MNNPSTDQSLTDLLNSTINITLDDSTSPDGIYTITSGSNVAPYSQTWVIPDTTIDATSIANIGPLTIGTYDYGYGNELHVNGDANFEGDIKIRGKSLVESLEKIEEKLAILRPNEALEEKWEQLRGLRKAYMELEKEIIEKEKVWEILKR